MELTERLARALELVWRREVKSRSELARYINISRPTASTDVDTLIKANYLQEYGVGESSGGKPPTLIRVNPEKFYSVGIDIGYEKVAIGVKVDASGTIVQREEISFINRFGSIASAIVKLADKLDVSSGAGLGIGVSGIVNSESSEIIESAHFDITAKPLIEIVAKELKVPVCIDNRSRMATYAEQFSGAATHRSDFVLLSLGKSIGSSAFIDKKIYNGKHYTAGEIRSIIVPGYEDNTFLTLEEVLSEDRIRKFNLPLDLVANRCAVGVRQILNIFDVDLIVLAGRFANLGPKFIDDLNQELAEEFSCNILPSQFGRESAAFGGAISVIQNTILVNSK